jgi:hypothetical protein
MSRASSPSSLSILTGASSDERLGVSHLMTRCDCRVVSSHQRLISLERLGSSRLRSSHSLTLVPLVTD